MITLTQQCEGLPWAKNVTCIYITCRDDNATPLPSLSMFTSQLPSTLALFPGPSPLKRGLVHTVCACGEIFRYIFHKKLCALFCPYAEDYTNQEYRLQRRFNCRILLFRRGSIIFPNVQSNRKLIYQKSSLVATEYLSPFVHGLYCFCLEHYWPLQQKRGAI